MSIRIDHNKVELPKSYLPVAGLGLAHATEVILGGQIFNRIATEQQANPNRGSPINAVKYLYNLNGIKEFYRGFRWNLLLGAGKGPVRWGFADKFYLMGKKYIPQRIQESYEWSLKVALGLQTAALETALYCPLETLKTRTMTQYGNGQLGIGNFIRTEGISKLFRGWTQLFLHQSIAWTTHLLVYDSLRDDMLKQAQGNPLSNSDKFYLGAKTGALATVLTTPFEMLKTRVQMHNPLPVRGIVSTIKAVYEQHGIIGFYRSLPMRMMRSSLCVGVTIVALDFLDSLPKVMKLK